MFQLYNIIAVTESWLSEEIVTIIVMMTIYIIIPHDLREVEAASFCKLIWNTWLP